jgi:adenine/guanine phosphoribosyltransferase-like PRPP-binding protein
MSAVENLRAAIRDVIDFPKPGIIFKDITPILADGKLFRESISLLCETARPGCLPSAATAPAANNFGKPLTG